jgi:prepilin-type N-terminal cleavage/methylation domain-containing protein
VISDRRDLSREASYRHRSQVTDHRSLGKGFTLLEVLVAVTVSAILFGLCVAAYVQAGRYKSRSETLLELGVTARGVFDRLAADLEGLHAADSDSAPNGTPEVADYWELETGAMGAAGDRLTFRAATENPGDLDYCTVRYYVENGTLYRELSNLKGGGGSYPLKAECVLAEGVQAVVFGTSPGEFALASPPSALDGRLPGLLTVTLQLVDPRGRPAFRVYSCTLRPGAEER